MLIHVLIQPFRAFRRACLKASLPSLVMGCWYLLLRLNIICALSLVLLLGRFRLSLFCSSTSLASLVLCRLMIVSSSYSA